MTYDQILMLLPDDAEWFCSFGQPGNPGYSECYRTPNGDRWYVSNGTHEVTKRSFAISKMVNRQRKEG